MDQHIISLTSKTRDGSLPIGAEDQVKNRLSVKQVADLMGASEWFIRRGLQQGMFPWGYAVKTSSKYTYWISAAKFTESTGIKV